MSYVQNETIRALRERKALTQKQLAEKLCISDKTISKWETGKGLPDISLLEDLARVLGVSLTELMTCKPTRTAPPTCAAWDFTSALYPEQDITVRFKKRGHGTVYAYCNRDGLFSRRL